MSLIRIDNLTKYYEIKKIFGEKKIVRALDGVSLQVAAGKTLGIVGESGCGKSTLAKTIMGLETKNAGTIFFGEKESHQYSVDEKLKFIQMIFQDPYSSINPRKKAWEIISEPLSITTKMKRDQLHQIACDMMKKVGLRSELSERYPHMFSGGQRQRLGIARALVSKPKVLILDEPISALDVSIQAQVLNLLMDLQDEMKLTYIFIGHDLNVINHLSDFIMVMYLGKVVEYGTRDEVFNNPKHPYTIALLLSSPLLNAPRRTQAALQGEMPSPLNPPSGCSFHKRCPVAVAACSIKTPVLRTLGGRQVACDIL